MKIKKDWMKVKLFGWSDDGETKNKQYHRYRNMLGENNWKLEVYNKNTKMVLNFTSEKDRTIIMDMKVFRRDNEESEWKEWKTL